MKHGLKIARLEHLFKQRNIFLAFSILLLITNLISSSLLFIKNERVILMPPELSASIWIEHDRVSSSYLEEMGMYFTHLMLDKTPASAHGNNTVLLRYIEPSYFSSFKKQLMEDDDRLIKNTLSTRFVPEKINSNPNSKMVKITGQVQGYVGSKLISEKEHTYILSMEIIRGRIFLKTFKDQELPS